LGILAREKHLIGWEFGAYWCWSRQRKKQGAIIGGVAGAGLGLVPCVEAKIKNVVD
jgi:hypothetical protein